MLFEGMTSPSPDPVLSGMLRYKTGLEAGGPPSTHDVIATYRLRNGETPFALCREGILLEPTGSARFVRYAEIADAGYYNRESVRRAKVARTGTGSEPLTLTLRSGDTVDLPMDVRDDGMPDLLTIAHIIHRRACLYRPRPDDGRTH